MSFDRKYLISALCYAIAGMCLGIFMAASHNHGQHVTHAHAMLVGFVVALIYGVIHKLWLPQKSSTLASAQFIVHQLGAILMVLGLFLLYGEFVPEAQIETLLKIASLAVLLGAVLMLTMVVKSRPAQA